MLIKKIVLFSIFILPAVNIFSMESAEKKARIVPSTIGEHELVTLISQDGLDFKVEVGVAKLSETLKNLIKDVGTDTPIPLPNITGRVLAKILELLPILKDINAGLSNVEQKKQYVISAINSLDGPILIDFIAAVNYLDIPVLLRIGIYVAERTDIRKLPPSLLTLPKEIRNTIILGQAARILKFPQPLIINGPPANKYGVAALVTPDGSKIVARVNNGIYIFDVKSRKRLGVLKGRYGTFCITPDGSKIVAQQNKESGPVWKDYKIRIFDINSFKKMQEIEPLVYGMPEPARILRSICVTRDGSKIIAGSVNDIYVWNSADGQLLKRFDLAKGYVDLGKQEPAALKDDFVESLYITQDGSKLISASWRGIICIWDIKSFKALDVLVNWIVDKISGKGYVDRIIEICMTPDDSKIIIASGNALINLVDIKSKRYITTFRGHRGQVNSVAVTPDGTKIVSGSQDNTIRIWDIKTLKEFSVLTGHTGAVTSVCVTPDGNSIISGSMDNTIRLWDISVYKLGPFIKDMSLEQAQKVFNYLKSDHAADWQGLKTIFAMQMSLEQELVGAEPVVKKHKKEED